MLYNIQHFPERERVVGEMFVASHSSLCATSEGCWKRSQNKAAYLKGVNCFAIQHKLSVAA